MMEIEYLVIGGGPTGLGAACRLESKSLDWHLLEADDRFGGLAGTFVDDHGFTWDKGGHVQFSHYDTFDSYMDRALGVDGWLHHERESWVWIRKRFVPYPFQNNLHRLDPPDCWECVKGLFDASAAPQGEKPADFEAWMLATFGEGITRLFMRPYNFKTWACPPSRMDYGWIGERVAVPKLVEIMKSICLRQDEASWGPNRQFRFPLRGGTGAIWNALGRMLPAKRVLLNSLVEHVDIAKKIVKTRDGQTWKYRFLISTMPLNKLIGMARGVVREDVARKLAFASTNVVGVGVEGQPPDHLGTKCWMYFPESNSPYYRVTVFSNYSPNNVAQPGQQWSLMTETSESANKPVDRARLADDTLRALREDGLLPESSKVCSVAQVHLPQGYPVPFLGRDTVVDPVLRAFEAQGIFSRGRFGAWKYEVANMDHSFAQGYECVERLHRGGGPECEPTLFTPFVVNSRTNP